MKSFICLATIGLAVWVANGYPQESKKGPLKAELTKAVFMVQNLHCPLCANTLEGSMRKLDGVKFISVNFNTKSANVNFDEKLISAQEVAVAMYQTPHAMGPKMQYGSALLLSVPDAKDKTTGAKATGALRKVEGVANVTFYPQPRTVGIQFSDKGKATSADLFSALELEGLKGRQYGAKK